MRTVLLLSLFTTLIPAAPVTWNISGSFVDGGTFSGSYVFDATTGTLSNASISVAGGNTTDFPAFTFNAGNSTPDYFNPSGFDSLWLVHDTGTAVPGFPGVTYQRHFRWLLPTNVTDAGGTFAILSGVECYDCAPFRSIASGSVQSVATPEPATLGLTAAALLAGIGWRRRRP